MERNEVWPVERLHAAVVRKSFCGAVYRKYS